MKKTVALVTTVDISTVQGSTEAHYVANKLADRYDLHIYTPEPPEIESATHHSLPNLPFIPALILYNVILLPYFLYHANRYGWDIFYTYTGFSLSPFAVSIHTDATWIADFQTAPTGQSSEWADIDGRSTPVTRFYYALYKATYRVTLPKARKIITLSEELQNHIVTTYNVDSSNISLVPLGVDTDMFTPNENRQPRTESIDIVYLGSIRKYRGLETCIDALASDELAAAIHLHIIGDGPQDYLQNLHKKCDSNNLNNIIEWHGYVEHEDVPGLLAEMDAAISPLPDHQSYQVSSPAKLYEYLAVGLPIVCSDIIPHRDLLDEGRTGIFYQPGDHRSLANALTRLSQTDDTEWREIQVEARKTALQHDWESRMEIVIDAIEA